MWGQPPSAVRSRRPRESKDPYARNPLFLCHPERSAAVKKKAMWGQPPSAVRSRRPRESKDPYARNPLFLCHPERSVGKRSAADAQSKDPYVRNPLFLVILSEALASVAPPTRSRRTPTSVIRSSLC